MGLDDATCDSSDWREIPKLFGLLPGRVRRKLPKRDAMCEHLDKDLLAEDLRAIYWLESDN